MATVLLIEDNALNLKLFHDLLKIKNHIVIISKDGIKVLDTAIKEQPDLILMDIQLGNISGMDLIKDLKKHPRTKEIPIIAITAYAMKNEEIRITEAGCDLYLPKPISIDNFFLSLDKFIQTSYNV